MRSATPRCRVLGLRARLGDPASPALIGSEGLFRVIDLSLEGSWHNALRIAGGEATKLRSCSGGRLLALSRLRDSAGSPHPGAAYYEIHQPKRLCIPVGFEPRTHQWLRAASLMIIVGHAESSQAALM